MQDICNPDVSTQLIVSHMYLLCMAKKNKDKTISIRLSQLMVEALDARAILDEKDRTQVIREAISQYLDNPENSAEDRLEDLEEKYDSLEKLVTKLHKQLQSEAKTNNSLEIRVEELSRAMTTFLERLK